MIILIFMLFLIFPTQIYFISLIVSSIIVYKDAKARNENYVLWFILTLFFNFIAVILYIVLVCENKKHIKNTSEVIDMRSNDNNAVSINTSKRKPPVFLFFHLVYSVIFYVFLFFISIFSFGIFRDTSMSYTNLTEAVSIKSTDYKEYINSSVIAVDNIFEISKKNIDAGNIKTIKFNNEKEKSILLVDIDIDDFILESNSLKMDIFQENGSGDFKVKTVILDLENLSYDLADFKGSFYVNIYTESFIEDLELKLALIN